MPFYLYKTLSLTRALDRLHSFDALIDFKYIKNIYPHIGGELYE